MALIQRLREWIYYLRARRNARRVSDPKRYRKNGMLKTPGLSESEDHSRNPNSYNFDPDAAAHDPDMEVA